MASLESFFFNNGSAVLEAMSETADHGVLPSSQQMGNQAFCIAFRDWSRRALTTAGFLLANVS